MKDFYVQLTSMASQTEFPSNAYNSFKNRLPHPLQRTGLESGNECHFFTRGTEEDQLVLIDPDNTLYVEALKDVRERDLDFVPRTGMVQEEDQKR